MALANQLGHLLRTSSNVIGPVSQPCRAIHSPTSLASSTVTFMSLQRRLAIAWPPSSAIALPCEAVTSAVWMGPTSAPGLAS